MKRSKISFEPKLSLAKKISIKALDFGKLPKKFMSTNFKTNNFLNITRSSSNIMENLPSSLGKQSKRNYFMKPMTSRSRNDNAIKLNDIPKTSYMNVTPIQKMKQLSRNKNINNLFTQSIYHSYNNNHASAKCITFNTNNIQINKSNKAYDQFSLLNKFPNKGTSRNMSNPNILINNSTYNAKIKNKNKINTNLSENIIQKFVNSNINNSNYISLEYANGNKNIEPKNLIINGYKHNPNGKNFRGTISNFGSLSYKKYGIKVKKKKLLNKMEEKPFLNDAIKEVKNLSLFKNFYKLKIFTLWRMNTVENSKEYKYQKLDEFLNNKIINFYYKNKIIRKYNQIKKEEKTWKKLVIPKKNLEINEQNKGSILISLYEYANTTIQSVFFNNRIKNFNHLILYSISVYIFELMLKQINLVLYNIKYVFKYYYDDKKRAIIKRPSVSEIKEQLLNINSIIEKPNITNKVFQDFIINLSRYIANLNLNKNQTKPIVTQYLELYRGNNKINGMDIKKSLQFGNILNDFTALQIKDSNFIINEIMNLLKDCKNNLYKYYLVKDFDDGDNFFILLYKIQPIKFKIGKLEEKIKSLNEQLNGQNNKNNSNNNNKIDEIKKDKEELKKLFNKILEEIQSKYQEDLVTSKDQNIKTILPFLIFQLLKYNITYTNLFEGISLLEKNKNYLSLKKNKEIYNTYNKLYNNGYIDFDYIIYLCLNDKYSRFIERKISDDINENRKLLYKLLIYIEEMNLIYNKINVFEDNKLTQTIKSIHNEILKNDEKIEKLKKIIIHNKNLGIKSNNKNDFNDIYKEIISHYIKYDINKKDNNSFKNISNLEKVLFKQLININNKSYIQNSKLNMKKEQKDFLQKLNTYNYTNDINLIKDFSPNNRNSKKFIFPDKMKLKGVSFSYPRILFLSDEDISTISSAEKISLIDISKYYNLIHKGQELELKGITMNKNVILGIQLYDSNRKESEFFKFNNPVNIVAQNKNNKNILGYLSNLYSNIKLEIENSLTKQLVESLSLFSKKDFHDWVNSTFSQITICTLCLIFTHEISKLLVQENNNSKTKVYIKDYKLILEKYTNFLQEECSYINNIKDRINVTLTIISQMSIIESLIANDIHDINSFNWLKYIRHLWDKNKKEVIIECGGWANYQMKKLNKYRYRLLISPDTDKIFLFNSSCFREKSASIIKVINNKYNNTSYKEIFEEYCSLFWTDMIDMNLAITPTDEMKRIFDVCTTDCSWIYIDNLDLFKYDKDNKDNSVKNNLIYFSKFIQTIQQEVILNDIKLNEGEKMFCLMSCLNVDDDIKNKSECLKGSCRILNFIKPDIEFYLNISFKLYKYMNREEKEDKINQNLSEILLKNEKVIRDKLNGFYFDFDYFNEYLIYILRTKPANIININETIENLFISFLDLYSNKFMGSFEKNSLDEHLIVKYFENKHIIIDNERIQLIKYLFSLTKNKVMKQNIILKGYSRHFMIETFKNFYFQNTNQKLDIRNDIINGNINIIYFAENGNLNNTEKIIENKKIFALNAPKGKNLINIFFDEFNNKLKRINYLMNGKYKTMMIEYVYKVIKSQSNNVLLYRSLCNFKNWMNQFLDSFERNKNNINDVVLYNIINDCLLITLGHEKNRTKILIEASKELIDPKLYNQSFENVVAASKKYNSNYFYFDIDEMAFKAFSNCIEYIKSFKNYLSIMFPKTKILFILSEFFANKKSKDINIIFNDSDNIKLFITDEITKLYNDKEFSNQSQILKIFVGFDMSYNEQNINMNFVNKNENISKFIEKINRIYIKKFIDFLHNINTKNLTKDDLNFIYKSIDANYKENIDTKKITSILDLIKGIYKAAPKANYYINVNNNLIKYLLKNQILLGVSSLNYNIEMKNINYKSNNIYLNINNDMCIKIISEVLFNLTRESLRNIYLVNIIKSNEKHIDEDYLIEEEEINLISTMVNDIYNIPSETAFLEKYQNNPNYFSVFKKIFNLFQIQDINITNDNYINSRMIIQLIKYGKINKESLNYKCLSTLSDLFNNNSSKIHEISILINETLNNYKELISNKKEYINSKYYFFKQMKISAALKENIYNSILEKIYLSMSNHFLFSLLLTIEIMLNNFEISLYEKEFLLDYLKQNYIFLSNNTIKYKYETEFENYKINLISTNGKNLIEFYKNKSKSIDDNYLSLLKKSLDNINNKYFFTSSLKKINRDVDKLLYYITFYPEQSSSMFKYIINKYLLKIINFSHYNINDALRKPTTKENLIPITVNAFPSINVINFLCSLSAYYEINFYIVRNGNIYNKNIIENSNFGYQYLIDGGLFDLIKEGMQKGYWILISEKIDVIKFMKILYELYNNLNEIGINKNFKIFFDEKLIEENCQKAIENNTMIININYENVDDLEAAHDIWVNVLEEKILTDSVMNQTQKDVLEIIEDSSDDKTNLIGHSINFTGENKNLNMNNTGNSIISFKSMYNNSFMKGHIESNHQKNYNLQEITNWTFLQNI